MCISKNFFGTFSDVLHSYEGVSSCTNGAVCDAVFCVDWTIVRDILEGDSSFTYCSSLHPVCRVLPCTIRQAFSNFPVLSPRHILVTESFFTVSDLSFL